MTERLTATFNQAQAFIILTGFGVRAILQDYMDTSDESAITAFRNAFPDITASVADETIPADNTLEATLTFDLAETCNTIKSVAYFRILKERGGLKDSPWDLDAVDALGEWLSDLARDAFPTAYAEAKRLAEEGKL